MIQKQTYTILTDTGGDWTDTGPSFAGEVKQLQYVPDGTAPLDTGCDIDIVLAQSGAPVANYDNIGGAGFTKRPSIPVADTGGALVTALRSPPVSAGEALRVSVAQSANAVGQKRGTLYVWVGGH